MQCASEVTSFKIRVADILSGAIRTPINRSVGDTPEAEEALLTLVAYNRIDKPFDIGQAALWLAPHASDYLSGTTLCVDVRVTQ